MGMTPETPVATFAFVSGPLRGTQLTLFASRLLHHGVGQMESFALGAIDAVRVGYRRDTQRIGWGAALALAALLLFLMSGPLGAFAERAGGEVADAQAMGQLLRAVMRALEIFAGLMPVLGAALLLWGGALIVSGWLGSTELVLTLAASERAYGVRGRNPMLADFAQLLAERAAHRG
jgi:hypothetical protein